tara:strand:- start:2643 stop:3599 length:957 start_codon:yes stop_codon:yes gene_type:complete
MLNINFEKYKNSFIEEDSIQKIKGNKNNCAFCNNYNIIQEAGNRICKDCGRIDGIVLDAQQEWRYYGVSDNKYSSDPTRCAHSSNSLFDEVQFGGIMKGYGNEKYRRLLKWNSIQYKVKSLMGICKRIQDACKEGEIPYCVTDKANFMYKMVSENVIKRGISRSALIAACVYYACKDKNIPRKRREISDLFDLSISRMTVGCNVFKQIMFSKNANFVNNLTPSTVVEFIKRNCILLSIDNKYRDICLYIADIVDKLGLVMDNIPSSISVGCVYLMCQNFDLDINKKVIAAKCNISQVTISKTFKVLNEYKKYLLPIQI